MIVVTVDASMLSVRRELHAAHLMGAAGGGWDLEWIAAQAPRRSDVTNLPPGFEYHSGNLDGDGVQTWFFCRKAPLSPGRCGKCPYAK